MPRIDAGSGECSAFEQRGQPRPVDGDGDGNPGCDIGAFEHPRVFDFTGFFAPVDNLPVRNTAKAGAIIPIRFSLDGYQGLDILASGCPRAQQVPCSAAEPQATVEQTLKGKASGLTYDVATDTDTYAWRTERAWAGTCRQLLLQFTDGQIQVAKFGFKWRAVADGSRRWATPPRVGPHRRRAGALDGHKRANLPARDPQRKHSRTARSTNRRITWRPSSTRPRVCTTATRCPAARHAGTATSPEQRRGQARATRQPCADKAALRH